MKMNPGQLYTIAPSKPPSQSTSNPSSSVFRNLALNARKSAKREDKKSLLDQVLASMPKPPEPPPPPEVRPQKRDLWAEIERIKAQRKGPA